MEAVNQQSRWKPKWTHDEHLAMVYHVRTEQFDRTLPGSFSVREQDCWNVMPGYEHLSRKFASDMYKHLKSRSSGSFDKAITEISQYKYSDLLSMQSEWYATRLECF